MKTVFIYLAVGLLWLLHWLPLPVTRAIGNILGRLLYAFGRERREVAKINLRLCFPDKSEDEIDRLARAQPAGEIVARVLAEMAAAGAAALQGGQAHRASDIDLAAVLALGFPRSRGGPMFQADRSGLLALRKRLRGLVAEGAAPPPALLDALIRDGQTLAGRFT